MAVTAHLRKSRAQRLSLWVSKAGISHSVVLHVAPRLCEATTHTAQSGGHHVTAPLTLQVRLLALFKSQILFVLFCSWAERQANQPRICLQHRPSGQLDSYSQLMICLLLGLLALLATVTSAKLEVQNCGNWNLPWFGAYDLMFPSLRLPNCTPPSPLFMVINSPTAWPYTLLSIGHKLPVKSSRQKTKPVFCCPHRHCNTPQFTSQSISLPVSSQLFFPSFF